MKAAAAFNLSWLCLGLTLGTSGHIAVVSGFSSSSFTRPHSTGDATGTCASSASRAARGTQHVIQQPLFASTKKDEGIGKGTGTTIPKESPIIERAAANVLSVAQDCFDNSATGVFLSMDSQATKRLKKAVEELEAVSSSSSSHVLPSDLVGDWRLVCTTSKTNPTKLFGASSRCRSRGGKTNPNNILQKAVKVVQRIRKMDSNNQNEKDIDVAVAFNRVDNVIEIAPPAIVEEIQASILEKLPFKKFLPTALLNPLEVTRQKVSLVHKARIIESTSNADNSYLRTTISLQSIILNLAGQNTQYLEPEGADVLGVNFPFGDLLQSGSFDTTFVNDKMRVSRGTIGILDELRVFVKEVNTTRGEQAHQAEEDVAATLELANADAAVEQDTDIDIDSVLSDSNNTDSNNNNKTVFETMAEETSEAIATELRALVPIPAVADAVDVMVNATLGNTPLQLIQEASQEVADLAEDVVAEAITAVDALEVAEDVLLEELKEDVVQDMVELNQTIMLDQLEEEDKMEKELSKQNNTEISSNTNSTSDSSASNSTTV
jgi:hypothetical protein